MNGWELARPILDRAPTTVNRRPKTGADLEDGHAGAPAGEAAQVVGVVGGNDASAESGRGGHRERVDDQAAGGAGVGEQVPGDAGDPGDGGGGRAR